MSPCVGETTDDPTPITRTIGRLALGTFLLFAGLSHLAWNRSEFLAQVPPCLPVNGDAVVLVSGVVEIILGSALIVLPGRRVQVGWLVAAFFVLIFPGNISQFVTKTDAFGLNSDVERAARLAFQPLLVLWTLWSTGAWRRRRGRTSQPR